MWAKAGATDGANGCGVACDPPGLSRRKEKQTVGAEAILVDAAPVIG